MLFLIYSATNSTTIESSLGFAEYSYYFVLKDFLPMLEKLGEIRIILRPELEVDAIYYACKKEGRDCLFLSFSPPNKTLMALKCPTIPVFAWEFDTIPDEEWDNQPYNNWVLCLQKLKSAIVHSQHTVNAVKRQLGDNFPVAAIWAPLWDRFESIRRNCEVNPYEHEKILRSTGQIIDSNKYVRNETNKIQEEKKLPKETKLQKRLKKHKRSITKRINPLYQFTKSILSPLVQLFSEVPVETPEEVSLPINEISLKGIIYTSVFNPCDGRKNWFDMVIAFCTAFINNEDATLILKFTHHNHEWPFFALLETFRKLRPFKCRVIAIHGFLDEKNYNALIAHSTYIVNTSHSEGQCLPLMEYMSCGKPAITPCHTAMEDYISNEVAFIVNSEPTFCSWPQDTRMYFRAHRYHVSYQSLMNAYLRSYHVAKNEQGQYKKMSEECIRTMNRLCSIDASLNTFDHFLKNILLKENSKEKSLEFINEQTTTF